MSMHTTYTIDIYTPHMRGYILIHNIISIYVYAHIHAYIYIDIHMHVFTQYRHKMRIRKCVFVGCTPHTRRGRYTVIYIHIYIYP